MKEIAGVLLLISLIILPAVLVVGFSYSGTAHPIEKTLIKNDGFLEGSANDVEILFFGFAGCATVCPVSLGKMASVLDSGQLNDMDKSVGGLFVEVKSLRDEAQDSSFAHLYSRAFSSHIRGYTPDLKTYQQLAEEFILRLYESRDDAVQISHTDHFFILSRDDHRWAVNRVLSKDIDESRMADIVSQTLNKL